MYEYAILYDKSRINHDQVPWFSNITSIVGINSYWRHIHVMIVLYSTYARVACLSCHFEPEARNLTQGALHWRFPTRADAGLRNDGA